jgi:hypothetical protein
MNEIQRLLDNKQFELDLQSLRGSRPRGGITQIVIPGLGRKPKASDYPTPQVQYMKQRNVDSLWQRTYDLTMDAVTRSFWETISRMEHEAFLEQLSYNTFMKGLPKKLSDF